MDDEDCHDIYVPARESVYATPRDTTIYVPPDDEIERPGETMEILRVRT